MKTILLVDDDPILLTMYKTKFKASGYQVETASDGVECLSKMSGLKPDIILLDIMMPKMDGLNILKKLKGDSKTAGIPIIILSNVSSTDADVTKVIAMGAEAYLVKADYTPLDIVKKVEKILGNS